MGAPQEREGFVEMAQAVLDLACAPAGGTDETSYHGVSIQLIMEFQSMRQSNPWRPAALTGRNPYSETHLNGAKKEEERVPDCTAGATRKT